MRAFAWLERLLGSAQRSPCAKRSPSGPGGHGGEAAPTTDAFGARRPPKQDAERKSSTPRRSETPSEKPERPEGRTGASPRFRKHRIIDPGTSSGYEPAIRQVVPSTPPQRMRSTARVARSPSRSLPARFVFVRRIGSRTSPVPPAYIRARGKRNIPARFFPHRRGVRHGKKFLFKPHYPGKPTRCRHLRRDSVSG